MSQKEGKTLTTQEAAELIGIKVEAVQNAIWRGVLPAVKRGRDWLILEADAITYRDTRAKPRKQTT